VQVQQAQQVKEMLEVKEALAPVQYMVVVVAEALVV
jgi:hypothetical protein